MERKNENAAGANCGVILNSDLSGERIGKHRSAQAQKNQRLSDSIFDLYQRRFLQAIAAGYCPVCHGARPEMEFLCDVPMRSAGNKSKLEKLNRRAASIMGGHNP